jgi:hypothetical protein
MKRIVVVQSGWVFVGAYSASKTHITLDDAKCIRVWGTEHGLGQLAIAGPQKATVLDPAGRVEAPVSAVLLTLECNEKVWA